MDQIEMTPEEADTCEGMEMRDISTKTLVHIMSRDGNDVRVKVARPDEWGRHHEYITPIEFLRQHKEA